MQLRHGCGVRGESFATRLAATYWNALIPYGPTIRPRGLGDNQCDGGVARRTRRWRLIPVGPQRSFAAAGVRAVLRGSRRFDDAGWQLRLCVTSPCCFDARDSSGRPAEVGSHDLFGPLDVASGYRFHEVAVFVRAAVPHQRGRDLRFPQ